MMGVKNEIRTMRRIIRFRLPKQIVGQLSEVIEICNE